MSAHYKLYEGDNLAVMRGLPSESIDLIYIDPPYFSQRNYYDERLANFNSAKQSVQADVAWFWICPNCEQKNGKEYNVCWRCDQPRRTR